MKTEADGRGRTNLTALDRVQALPGVGPRTAELLAALGIQTVIDLAYHLPHRYEDRRKIAQARELVVDQDQACCGRLLSWQERRGRSGRAWVQAVFEDPTGLFEAVWFHPRYVVHRLRNGAHYYLYGRVRRQGRYFQFQHPEFVRLNKDEKPTLGLKPIYPLRAGVKQPSLAKWIRQAVEVMQQHPDPLEPTMLERLRLPSLASAMRGMHEPSSFEEVEAARRRLSFEELFFLQVALRTVRRMAMTPRGYAHRWSREWEDQVVRRLPFRLTPGQQDAWSEIRVDMMQPEPMHRLLQGDVGSGKTVVAALALSLAAENGGQAAFLAPTEVLAQQHAKSLRRLLGDTAAEPALLTGGQTASVRKQVLEELANGSRKVVVGTHALLEESVRFQRLTLVVTDEQHRFGVRQRARLLAGTIRPDALLMSATPIPRTLCMAAYGDLDISTIHGLPPGRQPIATRWVKPDERGRVYAFVREQIRLGHQAYVICPQIEESSSEEGSSPTKVDESLAAETWAERLQSVLKDVRVGLLHGRLPQKEKQAVMTEFSAGRIDLLVSTTVVEVGVDVPNAVCMVIEGADRFGLAQLHQLRGRVGRGEARSYCILIADPATEHGQQRMRTLARSQDGFYIAEADLELRGPGELLGDRQHGLPELRVADLIRDRALLDAARQEAERLLQADPHLSRPSASAVRAELERRYGDWLMQGLVP